MGSTSITTDSSGDTVSEMRYSPWGSVRFSDGVSPTDYQFNGHLNKVDHFGLIYFQARWFYPALGRFSQADTFIPGVGNLLAFDRYMYAFSNPLIFVDPTGNIPESDTNELNEIYELIEELALYGIEVTGIYDIQELKDILEAAKLSGQKLSEYIEGESTYIDAFRMTHGKINIEVGNGKGPAPGMGNCYTDGNTVYCNSSPNVQNTLHEFGHVFDNNYKDLVGVFASGDIPLEWEGDWTGYMCDHNPCMAHSAQEYGVENHDLAEEFADMYMNWVLHGNLDYPENGFDLMTSLGVDRLDFMNGDFGHYASMEYWLENLGIR